MPPLVRAPRFVIALGLMALPAAALVARPVTYNLPPEEVPAQLAQSDAEAVANNCMACHSLDYITTQPRHKGAQFWRDEVSKMINVYKAPIEPADADAAAAVLAKKFG
jgi:cytochrome c1